MIPAYKIAPDLGIVTIYPAIVVREGFDHEAFGVDLTESDLTTLLAKLQRARALRHAGSLPGAVQS